MRIGSADAPTAFDRGTLALWLVIAASLLFRIVGLDHLPGINRDEAYLGAEAVLFLPTAIAYSRFFWEPSRHHQRLRRIGRQLGPKAVERDA